MDHFAGLDVSVKETSICVVDDWQNHEGSEGGERASSPAEGSGEPTPTASSGSDWKLGRYRNGYSVGLRKQACPWSVSRRGICRRC